MSSIDIALQTIGNVKKTYRGTKRQLLKDVEGFLVKNQFLSPDLSLEMKEVTATIFILCSD